MRQTAKLLATLALLAAVSWSSTSQAAFFSFPRGLKYQVDRISFVEPALAPMAHTMFCLPYEGDCQVHGIEFRKRNIALTAERVNELNRINREINRDIVPQANLGGLATE